MSDKNYCTIFLKIKELSSNPEERIVTLYEFYNHPFKDLMAYL